MATPRKVALSLDAATVIRGAHPDQRRKIRAMVDALRERPEIGKPLRRELEGYWSARVGRYRVIYRWSGGLLAVVLVGPRANIHEDASRLRRRERGS
ncbi:MAG: type II toxin-antitoxin system RelE family toxin [Candidatus Limnocylindria bacterium]